MFLFRDTSHRMLITYHPRVGHLYVPNQRARIPHEDGGYYVVTNSLGFRSDVEFATRRGERPRILFFGDSFTAGDGCENHERFAERIGEMVGAEVYNYGVSGTGVDQSLLIWREFARDVEADLICLCVYVDSIERIKLSHRPSVDRTTGHTIQVPKPYFTLEAGELRLHHVPVPRERPRADQSRHNTDARGLCDRVLNIYRHDPRLGPLRSLMRTRLARLKSGIYRVSRTQPYEDYWTPESKGWRLTEAIIRQFHAEAAPTPILIVPLPTYHFYRHGAKPLYQPLFERLADPTAGLHVADVTTELARRPWGERERLSFRTDTHFSAFGHDQVARILARRIRSQGLIPQGLPAIASRPPCRPSATYVLGVSCFYHNSAASLVRDGQVVAAAEEERFTRIKGDRSFPARAINYCLEEAGIHQRDLAAIVYYDNAPQTFERLLCIQLAIAGEPGAEEAWCRFLPTWLKYKLRWPELFRQALRYEGLLLQEIHHRSHAASAFFPSPFERAAILTVDGVGEWATASIGVGHGAELRLLREMRFPHSLGLLYSAFTQFTGFKVNEGEYKMMGLAPYGQPRYVDRILGELVDLKEDGSLELNLEYFAFLRDRTMTNDKFAALFDGPARSRDAWITQREMDLARSVQVVTEEAMLRMARTAHRLTGEENLCLAGGVALNCVANGRLLREGPFRRLWIQPAAGDAGGSIGAALDAYHTYFGRPRTANPEGGLQEGSYLGPAYGPQEIEAFLSTHGYPYRNLGTQERAQVVAELLDQGKVVGHLAGRLEFGPRALGARSILGDARNREMQVNLNVKIKYRESFRPFAPSVLAERCAEYFELEGDSPYMMLVTPVRHELRRHPNVASGENLLEVVREVRSTLPAITHVDYSARIQTVNDKYLPVYYQLIKAFDDRTGCAVIVNTSFNVRGEPIVCTPEDAYRCFMRTEMDALVLEDFLLLKSEQPPGHERKGHLEEDDPPPDASSERMTAPLARLYRREFLPVAHRLKAAGQLKTLDGRFRARPSAWDEYSSGNGPSLFVIPLELEAAHDVDALLEALLGYFRPGPESDALRPVVRELISLGIRQPVAEQKEQVSDTMYVMS